MPRLIPGVLGGDRRRRVPAVSKSKRVPLWTVEPEGQLFQGIIRVPLRLCHTVEHTNERLEFAKLITANLERWAEWRRQSGWFIGERPRVQGPFDPPATDRKKADTFMRRAITQIGKNGDVGAITNLDPEQDFKWYIAEARFTREEPVYAKLEDMLELRHMALKYDVDPDRDHKPENDLPEAKDELAFEGGLDPMQVAEARRQSLGLKREDYLMGKLEEPL